MPVETTITDSIAMNDGKYEFEVTFDAVPVAGFGPRCHYRPLIIYPGGKCLVPEPTNLGYDIAVQRAKAYWEAMKFPEINRGIISGRLIVGSHVRYVPDPPRPKRYGF